MQTDRPTRCPACWAALPPAVGLLCPHCGRPVDRAPKKRRRRGGAGDTETSAATAASEPAARVPAPAWTAEPYQAPPPGRLIDPYHPYDPPTPVAPAAAHRAAAGERYETPPWAMPAPVGERAATPGAAGATATLGAAAAATGTLPRPEPRDPVEFPGTALPDGFFPPQSDGRRPGISRKALGIAVAVVVAGGGALLEWTDRNEAVASPARRFIEEPCAEYRDIAYRLEADADDAAAAEMAYWWFSEHLGDFERAAHVDPDLADAAAAVRWFNETLADPELVNLTPDSQFDARESPIHDACTTGPGRP